MKINKKLIMVELTPPKNGDLSHIFEVVKQLEKYNITSFTFADSPGGICRIDSVLTAVKVREELGVDVIPHICCRDKNALSLRAQILGAHVNGIRNMLFVTGDAVPFEQREKIKPVFNCNSLALMDIAADLNRYELCRSPVRYGGCVNYNKTHIETEIKRVKSKMEKGALFFFSQPVYTKEDADTVKAIAKATKAKIYCGIIPLVNRKNAEYIQSNVPGINIPNELLDKFSYNMSREEGEAVGVDNAQKMLDYINDFTYGYYFNFPFNRTYLMEQLVGHLD